MIGSGFEQGFARECRGHGDDHATGGVAGTDTIDRVFDDDAVLGIDAEFPCGGEIGLRIGFALGDVLSRHDRIEVRGEAESFKGQFLGAA